MLVTGVHVSLRAGLRICCDALRLGDLGACGEMDTGNTCRYDSWGWVESKPDTGQQGIFAAQFSHGVAKQLAGPGGWASRQSARPVSRAAWLRNLPSRS